jgi:hypothetical protein
MRVCPDILAMLPADVIGHSAVPSGERVAEAAVLVAFFAITMLLAVRFLRG